MSSQVESVLIDLNISGQQSLFIFLAADGSINRTGTGRADNQEHDLLIGVTDTKPFRSLMAYVKQDWLTTSGMQYSYPEQRGLPCTLTLMFKTKDGDQAIEFLYGSESEGPPQEVALFVQAAVDLTTPWFETMLVESRNLPPNPRLQRTRAARSPLSRKSLGVIGAR